MTSTTLSPRESGAMKSTWTDVGYLIAARSAIVAAIFSAAVALLLLVDFTRRKADDPLEAPEYLALRARLAESPDREALREQVRMLDLELRHEYFRQRRFTAAGAWLLLGGVVVALVAGKSAAVLRRKLPMPEPATGPHDRETPANRAARWSVAVLGAVLVVAAVALARRDEVELASAPPPEPGAAAARADQPGEKAPEAGASDEEIAKYWPRFRGPEGSGVSAYDHVPTAWDGDSGEGVLWKTPVPLPGVNSPVVWDDRVFLSGADEMRRQVYCFDADSGKLLWEQDVPTKTLERPDPRTINEQTGYAAPTTATDGRRVVAWFANGDVAAFDFSGKLLWARSLGIPENHYGHSISPVIHRNLVLLQFDQGTRARDEKSKLLALDAATGETVYEVPRASAVSWASPIVIEHEGRAQFIACGDPTLIAHDPADGSVIWRADVLGGEIGPSPVFRDGVVYVACEYSEGTALRVDGEGDVTDSHVVWTALDGLPDTSSPLATPDHVFLVASWGTLTCLDRQSGELLWEADFDSSFTSSPGWAGGRVYLFGDEGKCWIIEPGEEEGNVVAENDLGEECFTCPAFQDGRIYIRGRQHLFCLGEK